MILRKIFSISATQKQFLQLYKYNYVKYLSIFVNFNSSKHVCLQNNLNYINKINDKRITTKFPANYNFNPIQRDTENTHAYELLQSIPAYKNNLAPAILKINEEIVTENEFEELLTKHYRTETASVILNAFKNACHFASVNNVTLADTRFDKLVDGLIDKCQDLTDNELSELLICIRNYPRPETPESHNFHDIWSCLDDMCCRRINNWSVKKALLFADYWYLLGLFKYCDYSISTIKKCCNKVSRLTPSQLIQGLFYINVCRKHWSMFEIESRLEEVIDQLSLDEMAIVSLAFFKTQSPLKGSFITSRMIGMLLENTSKVHEITLTAILKVIRYSPHITLVDQITELLNRLVPEVDRLSNLCCLHISLLGTNTQLFHPEILTKICEKFMKNISSVRLKDLERLTFVLTLFNFSPKTIPNIFEVVLAELLKPERQTEIELYPRCLSSCIHYLGLQQIYSYELINTVMDTEYLSETYGKNKQKIGREILFLDASVQIDCPDYTGRRLNPNLRRNLSKWSAEWIPVKNSKYRQTAADKLMLDIIDVLEVVHGTHDYVHINYLLPHFQKPDIVLCKDKFGNPVNVKEYFEEYKMGDVMIPDKNKDLKWYAVVVGGWNMFIRGTETPVGTLATKLRQLERIGYKPVVVPWTIFLHLSRHEKEEYIINKIT